jgi:hypothetical protein
MKKVLIIIIFIILLSFVINVYGDDLQWFKLGPFWYRARASGDQSCGEGYQKNWVYYDQFVNGLYWSVGWGIGARNWTSPSDSVLDYMMSAADLWRSDLNRITMPLPDENGIEIYKYLREQPPEIIVDGNHLEPPFPLKGEEVTPTKIIGSAYQMVESWLNTSMGVTIRQRIWGWAQKAHNEYIICEFTFYNTGNVDLDDEIELPNQVLDSVYFSRDLLPQLGRYWETKYGEHPDDTLRIPYIGYHAWEKGGRGMGTMDLTTGFIQRPWMSAEGVVHADKSCDDHSDDPRQPQMTGSGVFHGAEATTVGPPLDAPVDVAEHYLISFWGPNFPAGHPADLHNLHIDYMPGTGSGRDSLYHHTLRMEDRESGSGYAEDFDWYTWLPLGFYSCGPYHMAPGDSFKVAWTPTFGSISPKTGWTVGKAWLNGEAEWTGPDKIRPPAIRHPELIPDENTRAKDNWIFTGIDSVYKNVYNAQWAKNHNLDIPIPPPAPSIEVTSQPDKIVIEWGNESEAAVDFAGYRVYRATGGTIYSEEGGQVAGDWNLIFECGAGTGNSLTNSYDDTDAERGVAYYYYVTAFDDGVSNAPGVNDTSEVLESGKWLNMTIQPAHLTRAPGDDLSDIRIVPNPYNISAKGLQYPGEPDKIMFFGLPPICTIRIYNESGDLIQTLEHTDGSGDEAWGDPTGQYFMITSSGQIPVSGLYIANIETPDGRSANLKFIIVR